MWPWAPTVADSEVAAADSSHFGCCGTGCIDGIEVGACCCDHMYRSTPCAAGECWVEVDFAAAVAVACMEYLVSEGDGGPSLALEIWSEQAQAWVDPPGEVAVKTPRAGVERRVVK